MELIAVTIYSLQVLLVMSVALNIALMYLCLRHLSSILENVLFIKKQRGHTENQLKVRMDTLKARLDRILKLVSKKS